MNIYALYNYVPMTCQISATIESMSGTIITAGTVNLGTGVYRVPTTATISPIKPADADYEQQTDGGNKGGWPDPPSRAAAAFSTTNDAIKAFLNNAGDENAI